MNNQKGIIINRAFEIIRKTYKEINRLKDDIADLISDYDPAMKFIEEYSYSSGRALHLRANHTFLFKKVREESESGIIKEERALVILCLFTERENLNRINLKDQPELWVGLLDIKRAEPTRPWDYWDCLKLERRKCFKNRDLRISGDVFEYHWVDHNAKEEEREEWGGLFVGYPLVEITNREVLKEKIIDKLFKTDNKNKT